MSSVYTVLAWLEATQIATAVREGQLLFPLLESVHVLGSAVVFGTIGIVDLQLLASASSKIRLNSLMADLLPYTWFGFALAALTGGLLFASNAMAYVHNFYFVAKLLLIGAAGINMLIFHLFVDRSSQSWESSGRAPWAARVAGATSLILWVCVVAAGRWIGFTMGNAIGTGL